MYEVPIGAMEILYWLMIRTVGLALPAMLSVFE
jgi:hypothetical protein